MLLIVSIATQCSVYRSVRAPGILWWSSLVSLRLWLRWRGVVSSITNLSLFLSWDPFVSRGVQESSSDKGGNLHLVPQSLSSPGCAAPPLQSLPPVRAETVPSALLNNAGRYGSLSFFVNTVTSLRFCLLLARHALAFESQWLLDPSQPLQTYWHHRCAAGREGGLGVMVSVSRAWPFVGGVVYLRPLSSRFYQLSPSWSFIQRHRRLLCVPVRTVLRHVFCASTPVAGSRLPTVRNKRMTSPDSDRIFLIKSICTTLIPLPTQYLFNWYRHRLWPHEVCHIAWESLICRHLEIPGEIGDSNVSRFKPCWRNNYLWDFPCCMFTADLSWCPGY